VFLVTFSSFILDLGGLTHCLIPVFSVLSPFSLPLFFVSCFFLNNVLHLVFTGYVLLYNFFFLRVRIQDFKAQTLPSLDKMQLFSS